METRLLEAVADGVWLIDRGGAAAFANERLAELLGRPRESLVGADPGVVLGCPGLAARLAAAAREPWEWEADRGDRWLRVASRPLEDGGALLTISDVTAQRRAEQRLRLIAEAARESIWDWDPAAGTVWRTEALQTMLGYRAEDVRTDSDWWQQLLHPDDRERVNAGLRAAMASQATTWSDEYRARRADGSYAVLLARATIIRDADGCAVRLVGSTADVTTRHRADVERNSALARAVAARAEAEAFARLIASLASATDPAETLQAAVTALPRLLELSSSVGIALPDADGLLRYRFSTGVPKEVMDRYAFRAGEGYVGRTFASGRPERTDDLRGDAASHLGDVDVLTATRSFMAAPLIARGRILGVLTAGALSVGAFDDHDVEVLAAIADHVAVALEAARAREAAMHEAAQKAAILDQMADGVLVADRDGRIVLANAAAGALFGVPPERMIGLTPEQQPWQTMSAGGEAVPADDRPLRAALAGHEIASDGGSEYRILAVDGVERWAWATARPLRDEAGAVQGAVLVVRDLTQRVRSDEALRRAQQQAAQAEKLRALGQMASGIAHDLNQSLGMVAGYADLARAALTAPAADVDTAVGMLDVVARAAMDGGETVRRLLSFARPAQEGPVGPVDVADLLDEVARLTAPRWRDSAQAEGRPIALEVRVEPPAPVLVRGSAAGLRQAITNLVFNAVDALPTGGTIRLSARRVGAEVAVSVSDDGVGMAPEVQARVFEPFFTTKEERGTGLGLAQVFGIVEAHGGKIELASSPGAGTAFKLWLPAAEANAAPREGADRSAPAGLRVLAVDDEPVLATMVARTLSAHGHVVDVAHSGEAALPLLEATPYDLIVSDLSLGSGINGWELADRVRRLRPSARVILATGWGAAIDAEQAARRGVDRVIAKPYRGADLMRVIASL